MVKKSRVILSMILIIVSVLLVGCLIFTGSRLANYPEQLDEMERKVYKDEDTHLQFWDDGVWYQNGEDELIFLDERGYQEGVLTMGKEDQLFRFVFIDSDTIYDESTSSLLVRSEANV